MKYLVEFQKRNGLEPDGIIGYHTLCDMKDSFGIKSSKAFAMFLGQIAHESANFKYGVENLNYSKSSLLKVFGKYFTYQSAPLYARNPQKIANTVYANRMGNGNYASGDGWNYRGRGVIQITGKNNYTAFGKYVRVDVLSNPDLVEKRYYWITALWFFEANDLWKYCDSLNLSSIKQLTKRINGGYNGLQHRIDLTNHFYKLIRNYGL